MTTLNIKATGIELTDAIREYVEKKLAAVEEKLIDSPQSADAQVEVGKTTAHHHAGEIFRAEITLRVEGKSVRAVSERDDLYAAIDEMKDKLEAELSREKKRARTLWRKGASIIKKILRQQ